MKNDNYPSCQETFSTLRIYSVSIMPNEITNFLDIQPSEILIKGELSEYKSIGANKKNCWFLTSKGIINSNDSRDHIDYLCNKLLPIKEKLKILIEKGVEIDISCYWLSKHGHGGPTLSPKQLVELAQLEIEIWYDFY